MGDSQMHSLWALGEFFIYVIMLNQLCAWRTIVVKL